MYLYLKIDLKNAFLDIFISISCSNKAYSFVNQVLQNRYSFGIWAINIKNALGGIDSRGKMYYSGN